MASEVYLSNHSKNCNNLARAATQRGQSRPFEHRDLTQPCDSYFTLMEEPSGTSPDLRLGIDAVAVAESIGQSPGTRPMLIPSGYIGSDMHFNNKYKWRRNKKE